MRAGVGTTTPSRQEILEHVIKPRLSFALIKVLTLLPPTTVLEKTFHLPLTYQPRRGYAGGFHRLRAKENMGPGRGNRPLQCSAWSHSERVGLENRRGGWRREGGRVGHRGKFRLRWRRREVREVESTIVSPASFLV